MTLRRRLWTQIWVIGIVIGCFLFFALVFSVNSHFNPVSPKALIYGEGWRRTSICDGCRHYKPYYVSIGSVDKTLTLNLYTHDLKADFVSRKLHESHVLNDIPILDLTKLYLDVYTDINYVIDIGAHVGAVSILSALMGKNVISIEADEESLKVLCSSIIYSNLQDKINIVQGVAGVSHKPVTWIYQTNGNYSGSYVDLSDNTWAEIKTDPSWNFDARMPFLVDNLIEVLPNVSTNNVLMVIDVNGFENIVLLGAHLFLRKANIRGILVNFSSHKEKKSGRDITQIIERIDLQPYRLIGRTLVHLDTNKLDDWPDLVLWL